MTSPKQENPVLHPDKVRKLLDKGDLTEDESALLLAMIGVDTESLSEEEQNAMDTLKEQLEGYDPEELMEALEHVTTAESNKDRELEWPELDLGKK